MHSVTPGRWRLIAASGISTLVVTACGAPGTGSSAATNSPTPSPSVSSSATSPSGEIIVTGPGPISLAATSESVWVELHRADSVARIDPGTNQQVEVLDVPSHCTIATADESVWATIARRSLVTHFAASSGEVIETFDVPDACGLAVDGDTAWVTSPGEGAVYVLQEGQAEPIQRIVVAPLIFDIVLDETTAWLTSESGGGVLWRIDRATYEVTRVGEFAGVGADPSEIAFGAIWLMSRPRGNFWKVDPADGSILGQVVLRQPSGAIAVGDALWITLYGGTLLELDPETLEIRSEQRLQYANLGPPLYAFDSLWISALENNVVLRIPLD